MNKLSKAIAASQWVTAMQLARRYPAQARKWSHEKFGLFKSPGAAGSNKRRRLVVCCGSPKQPRKVASWALPLHQALVAQAPYECIEAIVEAYPPALAEAETSYGRLPLHCACRMNASPRIVNYLVAAYKDACLVPDTLHRLPLHYALSNADDKSNESVIRLLTAAHPCAARGLDYKNWTPLFVALDKGVSQAIVKLLLDLYPEAVWYKTILGTNVYECVSSSDANSSSLRHLLREAQAFVESTIALPSMAAKSFEDSYPRWILT